MVCLYYEANWYLWYGYIMKLTDIYGMAKLWSWYLWYGYIMKLTDIYGMAKLWSWYLWYGYIMKLTDVYGMVILWSWILFVNYVFIFCEPSSFNFYLLYRCRVEHVSHLRYIFRGYSDIPPGYSYSLVWQQ